jgi:hypothetical protein
LQIERCEGNKKRRQAEQEAGPPRRLGRPFDRVTGLLTLFAKGLSGLLALLLDRGDQIIDANLAILTGDVGPCGRHGLARRGLFEIVGAGLHIAPPGLRIIQRTARLREQTLSNCMIGNPATLPTRAKFRLLADYVRRNQLGTEGGIGTQDPGELAGQLIDTERGDSAANIIGLCRRTIGGLHLG